MSPYIISYVHKKVDCFINPIDSIWLSSIFLSAQGILMPIVDVLALKIGVKLLAFVGCVLNMQVLM